MGSVTLDLQMRSLQADISTRTVEANRNESGQAIAVRADSVDLSFEVNQMRLRLQRMNNISGMQESANLLIQRAQLDLKIDFRRLDKFIDNAEALEDVSPDLLKEYLAVIKLLDKNTPDKLDSFFDEIETTLEQFVKGDESALERMKSMFVSVRVEIIQVTLAGEGQQKGDPLLFDLDGDGLELTSVEDGIDFDLNADGEIDRAAAPAGGDAFLAIDRNQNGRIDDGRELFGDQNGARDGYAELSKLDSNDDYRIDDNDEEFDRLVLFDGHGFRSLSSAGIEAISLAARSVFQQINGNDIVGTSLFERADGTTGTMNEALLAYK